MRLTSSCDDTLRIHVNACLFHKTAYHWRGQHQTLWVKDRSFNNKRSIATIKRDDRKLRDAGFITKKFRAAKVSSDGQRWRSSITHVTWSGIKYLVKRRLNDRSLFKLWKRICDAVSKKGPKVLRPEPQSSRSLMGVRTSDPDGWPFGAFFVPKDT